MIRNGRRPDLVNDSLFLPSLVIALLLGVPSET